MTSELTNESYKLIQSISNTQATSLGDTATVVKDYYETDGSFCSFNCCLAFIRDNRHNQLYQHSEELLMRMYVDVFHITVTNMGSINPAPSWRLLRDYGGCLSIDEFRASFQTHLYIDKEYVFSCPLRLCPVGRIYEERVII